MHSYPIACLPSLSSLDTRKHNQIAGTSSPGWRARVCCSPTAEQLCLGTGSHSRHGRTQTGECSQRNVRLKAPKGDSIHMGYDLIRELCTEPFKLLRLGPTTGFVAKASVLLSSTRACGENGHKSFFNLSLSLLLSLKCFETTEFGSVTGSCQAHARRCSFTKDKTGVSSSCTHGLACFVCTEKHRHGMDQ